MFFNRLQIISGVNHSCKYGLRSRGQPGDEKRTSSQEGECHQRSRTGMEILSLLESEEDDEAEVQARKIGIHVYFCKIHSQKILHIFGRFLDRKKYFRPLSNIRR